MSVRSRRVVGVALIAYGLIGLILFALVAVAVGRPLQRVVEVSAAIDDDLAAVVATLDETEAAVRQMAVAVRNVDGSLDSARTAVLQSSEVALGVGATMQGLGEAMNLSILGAQPLIGLAPGFENAGDQLTTLSTDLAAISTSLGTNQVDAEATADRLDALADRTGELATTVAATPDLTVGQGTIDMIKLGVYLVSAWLALLAIGCVGIGAYLLRSGRLPEPAR